MAELALMGNSLGVSLELGEIRLDLIEGRLSVVRIEQSGQRERGGLEANVGLNVVVELLARVRVSIDPQALGNEKIGRDVVPVVTCFRCDAVVELDLELIAVVDLDATIDQVLLNGLVDGSLPALSVIDMSSSLHQTCCNLTV